VSLFYLIRHGSNDWIGKKIAGRLPHLHLNAQGKQQAARLAVALKAAGIQRLISSPMERARETAQPLADALDVPVEISNEINEFDFGLWAGEELVSLDAKAEWQRFNSFRSAARAPEGESMLEVQARFTNFLHSLHNQDPEGRFALFGHADPIRTVLCYYLGMPLDFYYRLEISPGSYSVLKLNQYQPEVLGINLIPS
jgi:broad specificity phosphatase PhoE